MNGWKLSDGASVRAGVADGDPPARQGEDGDGEVEALAVAAEGPAFVVTSPEPGAPPTPLIFASPHSGRIYPAPMMAASNLDGAAIRRSEDAYIDRLIEGAPALGVTTISARFARVFLDLNREPWELDQTMFADELPPYARGGGARVAAGLGAIARVVAEGEEIYVRKLSFAEARARVEGAHRPYHEALSRLVEATRAAHGVAVLIDWHSMPAAAARHAAGGAGCDIVLGDRYGASCAPGVLRRVEGALAARGWRLARNAPYAGGYTTEHYGRPVRGVHALQIELNRALYLDEETLAPTAGFEALKAGLETAFAALAAADWSRL
jgi:N-formylglutamate amidohydrolase